MSRRDGHEVFSGWFPPPHLPPLLVRIVQVGILEVRLSSQGNPHVKQSLRDRGSVHRTARYPYHPRRPSSPFYCPPISSPLLSTLSSSSFLSPPLLLSSLLSFPLLSLPFLSSVFCLGERGPFSPPQPFSSLEKLKHTIWD